jgi:hypothetical protein
MKSPGKTSSERGSVVDLFGDNNGMVAAAGVFDSANSITGSNMQWNERLNMRFFSKVFT